MASWFFAHVWQAVVVAAGMLWDVGWSLVLGFTLSGVVQTLVSNRTMRELLGRNGPREVAIATAFGAASSSCSYASASISRTLFAKGAALVPTLAFLFSSTNLVIELGLVLWLLLAWQFAAAEWIGGVVLVAIMAVLVRLTYPARLVESAREHARTVTGGMDHDMTVEGATWREKLRNPQFAIVVARHVAMDWSMLWKDLIGGFLIAGALASFVPNGVWHALFLSGAPAWLQIPADAAIGPIVAMLTFVCSIGNVPMAAILWSGGIGFGGVLAFLYADLIVLPLLDVYRTYYGVKMAAYVAAIFYATMVASAIVMELAFRALHLVPAHANVRAAVTHVSLDYTFWLDLLFGGVAIRLLVLAKRHPMEHAA